MLKFDGSWRFHSPGKIAEGVVWQFNTLIGKIAAQGGDRQRTLEHFKSAFANAAGSTSSWSSNASWAETDLLNYMQHAADNAPLFIEAFYEGCTSLGAANPDIFVPDAAMINRVLAEHDAGYEIQPPDLIARNPAVAIVVPERATTLDQQAQDIIQQSLRQSDQYLAFGQYRQAVQEILWLLETVSTIFQGVTVGEGTVQGKYFNKIAEDLRRRQRGSAFDQMLGWATTLQGYLSSPTGGGVRHGADLKANLVMQENEARLYCNLIRSYITFLLVEYERIAGGRP
jgi:hypothetical protein